MHSTIHFWSRQTLLYFYDNTQTFNCFLLCQGSIPDEMSEPCVSLHSKLVSYQLIVLVKLNIPFCHKRASLRRNKKHHHERWPSRWRTTFIRSTVFYCLTPHSFFSFLRLSHISLLYFCNWTTRDTIEFTLYWFLILHLECGSFPCATETHDIKYICFVGLHRLFQREISRKLCHQRHKCKNVRQVPLFPPKLHSRMIIRQMCCTLNRRLLLWNHRDYTEHTSIIIMLIMTNAWKYTWRMELLTNCTRFVSRFC
jgi:hypothetical protein